MSDSQTIDTYNNNVARYRDLVEGQGIPKGLPLFLDMVPAGGDLLDFGCGLGNCAHFMTQHGYKVDCIDGSREMAKAANDLFGLSVTVASFGDLDAVARYDGIWANFSLLHAAKADFPNHIAAIYRALRPSGAFFLALKLGEGEKRDTLGRFYAYYQREELETILAAAGFSVTDVTGGSNKSMAGPMEEWIGLFCRRA
jgi:SAM-dependent methyltransferase